jgi:hypothetical protein
MVLMNWATATSFDRYASQPASRMRSSSPFIANAVTATTGMALISRSSLSHLVPSRLSLSAPGVSFWTQNVD